jgi:hypothetical protein
MTNEYPFVRKENSILTNGFPFVDFGVPFIRNTFSFQKNIKAFIMNGVLFVDFGFPFIRNVFVFQRNVKAFIMNGVSFVEFGFSFLNNGIIYSSKTDFLLDPVKRLLDDRHRITDRVGTQSDFKSKELAESIRCAFICLFQRQHLHRAVRSHTQIQGLIE